MTTPPNFEEGRDVPDIDGILEDCPRFMSLPKKDWVLITRALSQLACCFGRHSEVRAETCALIAAIQNAVLDCEPHTEGASDASTSLRRDEGGPQADREACGLDRQAGSGRGDAGNRPCGDGPVGEGGRKTDVSCDEDSAQGEG